MKHCIPLTRALANRVSAILVGFSLISFTVFVPGNVFAQETAQEKYSTESEVGEPAVDATQHFGALKENVLFFSSFNETPDADFAKGEGRLFTAENSKDIPNAKPGLHDPAVELAIGKGLTGDALDFKAKKRKLTFYRATNNLGYSNESWKGCVSFWLQLDPATDLEPGYCDPIQITDARFDDAAIWVDFTKDNPRDFRLGVIGDVDAWNPNRIAADANPEFPKRLIAAKQAKFGRDKWSHVVINFEGLNSDSAKTQFYFDGELQGELAVSDPFTWDKDKSNILLGLSYIGLFDELVVFDRPLSAEEIKQVYDAKGGSLVPTKEP